MLSSNKKIGTLIISLLIIVTMTVGGTAAFLITQTNSKENKFGSSKVNCEVIEDFDGTIKKNVNVKNTGDTEAYLRVRLVTYRVNADGQRIGGTAEVPQFTPGTNWVKYSNYYYYTLPVAPNGVPENSLIDANGIKLIEYTDADGGKQVIEVMAEAIQSTPASAVGETWKVSISQGSVVAYAG